MRRVFDEFEEGEPYTEEELRIRSEREYARPWARVFATLLHLAIRVRKLEESDKSGQ